MGLGAAIGGIGSAIIGGNAAKKAGKKQAAAAGNALALQRDQFDQTTENFKPFLDAGTNALAALNFELGLGDRPTFGGTSPDIAEFQDPATSTQPKFTVTGEGDNRVRTLNPGAFQANPTRFRVNDQVFNTRDAAQQFADANKTGGRTFNGIQASPAAIFALQNGRDTIEAGAAARGGLNSGATLAGLEKLRFGLSAQDRDNQLNRLAGLVDSGQGAAGQQAVASNAFSGQASNSFANAGNAQSAGIIGANNAIQSGINNAFGSFGFANGQGGNSFGNSSIFDGLFGGKGLGGFT